MALTLFQNGYFLDAFPHFCVSTTSLVVQVSCWKMLIAKQHNAIEYGVPTIGPRQIKLPAPMVK